MRYAVEFTVEARSDLRDIHAYIRDNDSPAHADYVVRNILRAAMTLRSFPLRGALVPELDRNAQPEYRQVFFKPYRIIYRVIEKNAFVLLIADGRRNLQALLVRRLTES